MNPAWVLLVALVVATVGAVPVWPHSRTWGLAPISALTAVLLAVLVLLAAGPF